MELKMEQDWWCFNHPWHFDFWWINQILEPTKHFYFSYFETAHSRQKYINKYQSSPFAWPRLVHVRVRNFLLHISSNFFDIFVRDRTRGSNFWSSFECEGGSHVNHMHAVSLLIHPNSSNLMIKCLDLFENSLLIRFQTVRKLTFDPVRTNGGGSKVSFRSVYQSRDHELFENSLLIRFELMKVD